MAIYTIDLTVTEDGVTPNTPQPAGHDGDHGAAVVRFHIPFEGYRYRVEIVDGNGGYDISDLLDAEDGVVSCTVPAAWTAAGIATLRLVAVQTAADGGETMRFHSKPAFLLFYEREDGGALEHAARPAWQETLDEAQFFLQTVERKLKNGELKGEPGPQGIQGIQGIQGKPFTYDDFTPDQLLALKGEPGDDYVLTEADKAQITEQLAERILGGQPTEVPIDNLTVTALTDGVDVSRVYTVVELEDNSDGERLWMRIITEPSLSNVLYLAVYYTDVQEQVAVGDRIRIDGISSNEVAVYKQVTAAELLGDIDHSLNRILEIQNTLIGGAGS